MKPHVLAFAVTLSGCVGSFVPPDGPLGQANGSVSIDALLLCSVFDPPQVSSLPCGDPPTSEYLPPLDIGKGVSDDFRP